MQVRGKLGQLQEEQLKGRCQVQSQILGTVVYSRQEEQEDTQTPDKDKEEAGQTEAEDTESRQEEEDQQAQADQQAGQGQEQAKGISEEQALMLLESYHQEEEPKGLYKEKIQKGKMPETLKDW